MQCKMEWSINDTTNSTESKRRLSHSPKRTMLWRRGWQAHDERNGTNAMARDDRISFILTQWVLLPYLCARRTAWFGTTWPNTLGSSATVSPLPRNKCHTTFGRHLYEGLKFTSLWMPHALQARKNLYNANSITIRPLQKIDDKRNFRKR